MRAAANEYRAKAFERLSLAECMTDPEPRAEFLRYARWWMQLAAKAAALREESLPSNIESRDIPARPRKTRHVLDARPDRHGSIGQVCSSKASLSEKTGTEKKIIWGTRLPGTAA